MHHFMPEQKWDSDRIVANGWGSIPPTARETLPLNNSSQLFAVYKGMCTIYRECSLVVASASSNQLRAKMATFDTDHVRTFQTNFDAFCKLAFTNCFLKFNDYTMPMLGTSLKATYKMYPYCESHGTRAPSSQECHLHI